MAREVRAPLEALGAVLADRLLQLLLLGAIGAAFFFALALRADPAIVLGVLVGGGAAALIESPHHREK